MLNFQRKLEPSLITRFIPALMSLIVDDSVRALNNKLPPDERESAHIIIEHSGPPPDAFQAYISETPVACVLAMYYALQVARLKDKVLTKHFFEPHHRMYWYCLSVNGS